MATGKKSGKSLISSLSESLDTWDFLGILRRTPILLRKIIDEFSPRRLSVSAKGENWSRRDILAHMLDTETVMSFRIRKMLCEEDPNISFFDQEKWVSGLRPFRGRDPAGLASRFAALRADNLAILSGLTEDQMRRTGVHPESGRLTLEELAVRMARHDVNHLKQIVVE